MSEPVSPAYTLQRESDEDIEQREWLRAWDAYYEAAFERDARARAAAAVARRVELAAWRARNMRLARKRAGASCP